MDYKKEIQKLKNEQKDLKKMIDYNQLVKYDNENDINKLLTQIIKQAFEEREIALDAYQRITNEFESTHHFTLKGEIASKFLEIMNKSTENMNKLLSTIQKFQASKNANETIDAIISSNDKIKLVNELNNMGVGIGKFIQNQDIIEVGDDDGEE